jgi:hypothetical protein
MTLDIGTVVRIDATTGRPYVQVDRRTGEHPLGPCPVNDALPVDELTTGPASAGTAHTHEHGTPLAVGDLVLVGYVEGRRNDAVVVCRLR